MTHELLIEKKKSLLLQQLRASVIVENLGLFLILAQQKQSLARMLLFDLVMNCTDCKKATD